MFGLPKTKREWDSYPQTGHQRSGPAHAQQASRPGLQAHGEQQENRADFRQPARQLTRPDQSKQRGADMNVAILRETDLDGVDLSGVDLSTTLMPRNYTPTLEKK